MSARCLILAGFTLMLVLHQDFWSWNSQALVFGFLPMGLAYHALFSIGCALLGWLTITFWWPEEDQG